MPINNGNVCFYYIKGISRENTPYFTTVGHQQAFFAQHAFRKIIEDSYYVPHYKDIIKVESTDIDFNNKYNYVSIMWLDKFYYYFITSIEYISEDIIEVGIEIDTVQTYMFNVTVLNGVVDRCFINRVNKDNSFNRNYIRENLSEGTWEEPDYYTYLPYRSPIGLIGATYKNVFTGAEAYKNLGTFYFHKDVIQDIGMKLLLPFIWNEDGNTPIKGIRSWFTDTSVSPPSQDWVAYNQYDFLQQLFGSADIENIYYIPFIPFDDVVTEQVHTQDVDGLGVRIYGTENYRTSGATGLFIHARPDTDYGPMIQAKVTYKTQHIELLGVGINGTGQPYTSSNIVQVIDENYLRFCYGEKSHYTSFPLYSIKGTMLYCKCSADPTTGTRFYGITDDEDDYVFPKHSLVEAPPIYLPKYTEAWAEYWAYNRGTIAATALNFIENVAVAVATYGASEKFAGAQYLADLGRAGYNYAKGNTTLSNIEIRNAVRFKDARHSVNLAGLRSGVGGATTSLLSEAGRAMNAVTQPDSIKQTTIHTSDFMSGSCRQIFYWVKVLDFERIAYYYHQYGYKVSRPYYTFVNESTHVFSVFKTRYYFDYFKFDEINITLNCLASIDMINDLTLRFIEGVRQWYIESGNSYMCDYTYDNVELDYL